MVQTILQVAAGGAMGAVLRYLTYSATNRMFGAAFPYGTLSVNIIGSFIMGFLVVFLMRKGISQFAPFLLIGVLGGFTTFSAFSFDALSLYERGAFLAAFGYVFGTVFLSLLALTLGLFIARSF